MGGVDRNDEMKSYYAIRFRSRKWWHRVFFELLDRCVVNGHILELELPNHERRTLKEFRLDYWGFYFQKTTRSSLHGINCKAN